MYKRQELDRKFKAQTASYDSFLLGLLLYGVPVSYTHLDVYKRQEPTLLNHLLNFGYEPEHYLDMLENVETIKSDIEITKQNIAEPSDEWKDIVLSLIHI